MDKLILIYVFVALLQAVTSETEDSQVLPKDLLHVEEDDFSRREQADPKYLLPTLPTGNEPSKLRNNSNMNDISELQTASNGHPSSETENEPTYSSNSVITTATSKSISDSNNEDKLLKRPPLNDGHLFSMEEAFPSEVQHESDVNNSATSDTNKISDIESSQLKKQFQPLENRSADDESRGTAKESDKSDWFYEEKTNDDDDEDYTENEVNKDGSEEYKDEGDDIILGEHNNDDDDDDEEYDVTKWTQHGDDDNDRDWGDDTEDDFDESKNHLADELAKQNKQPTAPTRMVLFYTWMIVAVLLIIIGVSTYQSRCRGFRFFGRRASNSKDDRKRLVEHEFV